MPREIRGLDACGAALPTSTNVRRWLARTLGPGHQWAVSFRDLLVTWIRPSAVLTLLLVAGCGNLTLPHQAWTEARVEGRIIDATTHHPLAQASISRVHGPPLGDTYSMEKGATHMEKRPVVAMTDAEGQFVLVGEQTANLFLETFPDYAVTLRIQCPGYETVQRHFTNVVLGTLHDSREPVIRTGDLPLAPKR